MPQCERSRVFDASENTVRQWIQRYERNGVGYLDGRPRGGRPRRVLATQEDSRHDATSPATGQQGGTTGMNTSAGNGPIGSRSQSQPPRSCERVSVVRGDITEQRVDAIVNAANTTLPGGGGVDGAVHRAAGPELLAECRAIGGCNTGDAVITQGHRLPAKYVMYTVGPIWQGGSAGEADLLASCYISSLRLAAKHGVRTLAFPSISTGAYRYPLEQASQIAMRTVTLRLEADPSIENVIFVCFNERTRDAYQRALDAELAMR